MIIILVMILAILVLINCASVIAVDYMTLGKRRSWEQCFELNEKDGLYGRKQFEELAKEDVEVKSFDGLILRGSFIENYKGSKRVMIIVHGYNLAYPTSLQFIEMFFRESFNVLIIDQRGHGRSEGKYATYGYYEKYDLDAWVSWVVEKVGEDVVIGLHGQSMGAATVLEYAAINRHVKFIIADCPYSDAWQLIKHQFAKVNHVPVFPIAHAANFRLRSKAGFSLKAVSPINSIKDKDIPVMFVHGSEDDFVPTRMSEEMYRIKQDYKKLLIIEGAAHANSYSTNKVLYEREVTSFINEILAEDDWLPIKINDGS